MIPLVVTGIFTVLVLVRCVVTGTSIVSVLVIVDVVVYFSVTVVVYTFSGRMFTSRLEKARAIIRIRNRWFTG